MAKQVKRITLWEEMEARETNAPVAEAAYRRGCHQVVSMLLQVADVWEVSVEQIFRDALPWLQTARHRKKAMPLYVDELLKHLRKLYQKSGI